MQTDTQYRFTFLPLENITLLKDDWQTIEREADCSFFLSWMWISTWIETYQPDIKILRAYSKEELVAIAALVFNRQTRHHILSSKTLLVHQTGDPQKDQIWMEYNGILTKNNHSDDVTAASIRYLIQITDRWDELIFGAITDHQASLLENASNLMRHDIWSVPCYGIDLKTIRTAKKDYLSVLSRNTRYQIRRSNQLYQKKGKLIIQSPDSNNKAIEYFNEIAPLHIHRWGSGKNGSGFANQYFKLFHRNLIDKCWDNGFVDLLKIKVGNRVIAMFYNFRYKRKIYFYLSGLVSETDNKLKPGFTGHSLCVQKYIDEEMDFYDFMGGSEGYKSNLADKHQSLVTVALQKRKIKFMLENIGRKLKTTCMYTRKN